uniref:Protein tyrosine phosphatase n=1 Tax=Panagrolaimus sp. JU765 TaxID=591449 RepID=A0AC34RT14_9BILA
MTILDKIKRKFSSPSKKKGKENAQKTRASKTAINTDQPAPTTCSQPPPPDDGPAPSRIQSNTPSPAVNSQAQANVNVAKCHNNARAEVEKWAKRCLDKGVAGLREEFSDLKRYVPPDMNITTFQANWEAGRNRYKDVPCQEKCRVILKWPGQTYDYIHANYVATPISDKRFICTQANWEAGRNRYKDVPCQEKCRVILKWPGQTYDYIHANYVATPISDKRFICTQGPLESTITDFWHMVIQEETETVIMLCNIKEKGMDKCAQYWPLEEKEVKVSGDVEITNTLIRPMHADEPNVRLSVLSVKWKENGKECTREVRHYQWIDWPDRGVPPCRLTSMVLLSFIRGTKKPIVVHCSAGIGRTGTIVAIEFILERLQQGIACEAMDEILKELRSQRPYSIQTDLQYLYVVRVMLFYFFEKYKLATQAGEDVQAKYKKFVEDYNAATQ